MSWSSSYATGRPVGTSSRELASSPTRSRCLISALSVLPCETTSTHKPVSRSGTIASYQYGRRRAETSRSDSVRGLASAGMAAYRGRRTANEASRRAAGARRRCTADARPDTGGRHTQPGPDACPALQRAVVIGVQPPRAAHRDQSRSHSANARSAVWIARRCSGCVHERRPQVAAREQPAGAQRFLLASRAERDVYPAGEQVP